MFHSNCKGNPLVEVVNHPNWLTFTREPNATNNCPRVVMFINIRLSSFCFSFRKDIINHRDILLASFFNNRDIFWLINIYSDFFHSAIKYLKNTEFNIRNLLVMTGDFNIQDCLWNLLFNYHSSISDDLFVIVNSLNLSLSYPTNQVPIRYSDNVNNANLVINLMFLCYDSSELNTHSIHPEWHLTSNHAPLTISIPIVEEYIATWKRSITKNSKEEDKFIKEVIVAFSKLDMSNISDIPKLEKVVSDFANIVDYTWIKYSKLANITKHSKSW